MRLIRGRGFTIFLSISEQSRERKREKNEKERNRKREGLDTRILYLEYLSLFNILHNLLSQSPPLQAPTADQDGGGQAGGVLPIS